MSLKPPVNYERQAIEVLQEAARNLHPIARDLIDQEEFDRSVKVLEVMRRLQGELIEYLRDS